MKLERFQRTHGQSKHSNVAGVWGGVWVGVDVAALNKVRFELVAKASLWPNKSLLKGHWSGINGHSPRILQKTIAISVAL